MIIILFIIKIMDTRDLLFLAIQTNDYKSIDIIFKNDPLSFILPFENNTNIISWARKNHYKIISIYLKSLI